jgi:drug/metabolite transporter (DMT)-like permease
MSQTRANILMLIATLIWGTAFVSQTTGMGAIGPFTFSFSRFFFATITVLPLALYFERHNFAIIFSNSKLLTLTIATGFSKIRLYYEIQIPFQGLLTLFLNL